ncbi:MAG TPA: methyltransferase [Rhodospirillaceae bacterium]|nr:methyltransferase [Rhodospirillaceae bacterium]HAT36359.1 methyltransferase [Rhodospirillaceae bacterium]
MALVQAAERERGADTAPDFLLDGKLVLHQPKKGYRAAIDPVLLAAAVPATPNGMVLDIGCGVGTGALCYAHRVADNPVTGLEKQTALVETAVENIGANGLEDRVRIIEGDLLSPPKEIVAGNFQHVMANPPYVPEERADPAMDPARRESHVEGAAKLSDWIAMAHRMLVAKGSLTIIYESGRSDELLAALQAGFGGVVLFPLWPSENDEGRDAKRVLVQARKGVKSPARIAAGMVLHRKDGSYTDAAEGVLRHGAELVL